MIVSPCKAYTNFPEAPQPVYLPEPDHETGAFSPNWGAQAPGRYITSVMFASNDPGGADNMFVGQAPSQGFLSWRIHLDWQGRVMVLDNLGPGLAFHDTGHTWAADGQYREIKVDFDGNANSIKYYYDGALVWTSVAGVFAGTSVEQVILFGDNFHTAGTGWSDWDNLSIVVPAPGALALLGVAGLVGVRRRRK